jgi:hypothetical protein
MEAEAMALVLYVPRVVIDGIGGDIMQHVNEQLGVVCSGFPLKNTRETFSDRKTVFAPEQTTALVDLIDERC